MHCIIVHFNRLKPYQLRNYSPDDDDNNDKPGQPIIDTSVSHDNQDTYNLNIFLDPYDNPVIIETQSRGQFTNVPSPRPSSQIRHPPDRYGDFVSH